MQISRRDEGNCSSIKSDVDENADDVFCSSCKKVFSTSKLLEERITYDPQCKLNENLEKIKTEIQFETLNSEELTSIVINASNNTASSIKLDKEEILNGFHHKTHSLQNGSTPKKRYFCEYCSMSFSSNTEFDKHKQIHLKEEQQINDLKGTRTEEQSHAYNICNKGFSRTYNLKFHKRLHTGEKPYECDSCNKRFSQTSSLKMHKHTHTGEKPYACDICNKRFFQTSSLKIHKHTHTGEKLYVCKCCNNRFSKPSSLKIHKRTHTGEKPYVCDICNKGFAQSCNLHNVKNHTALYHKL